MMAVWMVPLLLLLALAGSTEGFQCPSNCFCFPNFDQARTITVDCRGLDLFEIPFPIPPETSSLDVSNNLIQFVRTIDLPDRLENLRFLQLQNNELMDIEPGAFANLPNLEVLRLTNNQVRMLRNGTFNGLTNLHTLEAYNLGLDSFETGLFTPLSNLVTLDLSYNNLDSIPTDTFTGFQRLQRLLLSDNFLTSVEQRAVANLPSLNTLNLANNQLRALDVDTLADLPRIISVMLQGNLFECGCDAVWLQDFIRDNLLNGPVCAQPLTLRGFNLLDLEPDQFCRLPTANIMALPVVIATGSTLQLVCNTTGFPPPTVVWSRDGMTFDPTDSRIRLIGGNLTISDVLVADSGDYHCVATSSAGQVSASIPVAVVNVPVNDTVTQATRRDIVLLDCVDMREVDATLMWTFNSTELQLSDKHTVIENGSLLIRNVDLEDMGEYVCTVGGLMLTQSLMVWAAPEFVTFPEGNCLTPQMISVDSDSSVDLVCSVFGIPPPDQVAWFYEGQQLLASNSSSPDMVGGVVTATVNLFRPFPEQRGNYTCVANSSLGAVERTLLVNVRLVLTMGTNPTLDAEHFVGDTAVLECDLGDRIPPESSVIWQRRSGLPLPAGRVIFVDRNTTLIIEDLTLPIDRDLYECIVILPNGTRRRLTYDLILFQPPVIEEVCGVPVITAVAGSNVSLVCLTESSPVADYQWTVNGTLLEESSVVNRSIVEIIGQELNRNRGVRLNISDVREGDNGFYNCSANNTIIDREGLPVQTFQDSYTVELQIQRLPYFTYQPEMTAVIRGTTATLLCGGRGSPTPTVTWFVMRDNETSQVIPDLRHIITSYALLIQNTEPGDQGLYFCEISSPLMTRTSRTAHLRVYTLPQFGPLPVDVRAPVGSSNVTLDCFGTGDPEPVVDWLRGDQILPTDDQVMLMNGSLVLLGLETDDSGVYTCRLANVAGSLFHNVTVTVLTLPDTRVEPAMVMANVGCQVMFHCTDGTRVVSDPSEIVWTHRGQRLEEGERVSFVDTGALLLSNLDVDDSGNYTCTLWSELGPASNTALLIVEDPIFASGAPVAPPSLTTSTPLTQSLPLLATAQFVCFADGFPLPDIEWLRDGEPQPRFRRVTFVNGGLTIRDLRITDNATYTCRAVNDLGSASIDFQLTISVAPSFDVRPLTQTVLLGGLLTLNCTASGNPTPDVLWLHNGSMVISEDNPPGRVFIDRQSNQLSINRMAYTDAGLYTCLARSNAGVTETSVPVFVQDAITRPVIDVPPQSVTTMAGLSVALDCVVSGVPVPTVTWLKDGDPIESCSTDLPMDQVCAMNDTIFIRVSEEVDTGRYTCIAENSAGVTVSEAFVSIEPRADIPVFEVYPIPAWLVNGSSLMLECQASGNPSPNISWQLDFSLINLTAINCSSGNFSTDPIVLCSNGSLIIPEVDFNDEGLYTCVADNGVGINQVSVTVDVGIATDTDLEGVLSRPILTSTPTVTLPLLPGSNLTLECTATGNPPPIISWLRNGVLIDFASSSNLFQLANGSLLLTMANDTDAGLYTCLAENSQGTAEVTFQLEFDVLGRLATGNTIGAPVVTMETKSHDIVEGTRVEFPCSAKGHPAPNVIWEHNGRMVYGNKRRQVVKNGSLIITYAQLQHSGNYSCMAVNKRGITHAQLTLTVTSRPVPPSFLKTPSDTLVVVGASFVLYCLSEAPLSWYQGNQSVEQLSGHKTLCDDSTLLVSGIEVPGSLQYQCSAYSVYGNSSSFATVTVTSVALYKEWYVDLGSSVVMTCEQKDGVWSRHGSQLHSSSTQFVNGDTIVLLSASLSDEGEYFCSTNLHYLHVTVPPRITSREFLSKAHQGDTVELDCVVKGRPSPTVTWYTDDGVQLTSNTQHTVISTGSLVLFNVSQSGQFDCLAVNIAGEDKYTVYLHVL